MEIGTIGAGALAQAFAKRALKAGHKLKLSNDRGPDSLREIVNQLDPGAVAVHKEVAASCELVLPCCSLGQRPHHTCESSQVEKSDLDRWDQPCSRQGRKVHAGRCWKLINEPARCGPSPWSA